METNRTYHSILSLSRFFRLSGIVALLFGFVLSPVLSPADRSITTSYRTRSGVRIETEIREMVRRKSKGRADHFQISRAILKNSRRYGMDPYLVLALVEQESRFNTKAKGRHGEIGLVQIKPDTAIWIAQKLGLRAPSAKELWNPDRNLRWGLAYLSYLHKRYSKDGLVFLDAYNMGVARMNRRYREGASGHSPYAIGIEAKLRSIQREIRRERQLASLDS